MWIIHRNDPTDTMEAVKIDDPVKMDIGYNDYERHEIYIYHGDDCCTSVGCFKTADAAEKALEILARAFAEGTQKAITIESTREPERKDRIDYEEYSK